MSWLQKNILQLRQISSCSRLDYGLVAASLTIISAGTGICGAGSAGGGRSAALEAEKPEFSACSSSLTDHVISGKLFSPWVFSFLICKRGGLD